MAVEEVKRLLDLLNESPGITELMVQGTSGSKVTLKRQIGTIPALPSQPVMLVENISDSGDEGSSPEVQTPSVSIVATLVGIFHEASPPLSAGSSIVVGQIVGYIESMRLMNEVVSAVSGDIAATMILEGQPVEYGQPLFSVLGRQ
jgi:acetyl-CoA carboxylase biotin carboxyl carrier protein